MFVFMPCIVCVFFLPKTMFPQHKSCDYVACLDTDWGGLSGKVTKHLLLAVTCIL